MISSFTLTFGYFFWNFSTKLLLYSPGFCPGKLNTGYVQKVSSTSFGFSVPGLALAAVPADGEADPAALLPSPLPPQPLNIDTADNTDASTSPNPNLLFLIDNPPGLW
jgi:hypothetical protein